MTKTYDQALAEFNAKIGPAHSKYQEELEKLRNDGAIPDDERGFLASQANADFREAYAAALEKRNEEYARREDELRGELFGGSGGQGQGQNPAFTESLTRVAMASDDQLDELAALAAKTGDKLLTAAVLSVADERGRGEAMVQLMAVDEGIRSRFAELRQIPDAAARQKSVDDATHAIPPPAMDEVRPTAEAVNRAAAERQQAERERADQFSGFPPLR